MEFKSFLVWSERVRGRDEKKSLDLVDPHLWASECLSLMKMQCTYAEYLKSASENTSAIDTLTDPARIGIEDAASRTGLHSFFFLSSASIPSGGTGFGIPINNDQDVMQTNHTCSIEALKHFTALHPDPSLTTRVSPFDRMSGLHDCVPLFATCNAAGWKCKHRRSV